MCYNPFLVYCRELAPGTASLTGDRAQGDDSKHDPHCSFVCFVQTFKFCLFFFFCLIYASFLFIVNALCYNLHV